jgi:CBS-domain-containing membrane protein
MPDQQGRGRARGIDERVATGPTGGELLPGVRGVLPGLQLPRLTAQHNPLVVLGIFSFVNGSLAIGVMSLLALVTGQAFIFPSLGPTAFLFFSTPMAPVACPRNAICGHLTGALAGWVSLVLFGLTEAGPAYVVGVDGPRVAAAALSLGLTGGVMVLLKAPHPPAGATTLIVSLGILHTPPQLAVLMLAVVLLTLQAIAINRLAGMPYPLWQAASTP